jgi:ribosome-binding protein aMBF1 (putative translation factor)
MTAAVIQEPEVDAGEQVTRVEDLPDPVRREIVAQREAGTTLSELKANFPQVAGEVIREVLPPANAREARARERTTWIKAKTAEEAAKNARPVGGNPKAEDEAKKDEPRPEPKPRYATDEALVRALAERTLTARKVVGRDRLAELLGLSGSAVWRFEHSRIHPDEVEPLYEALAGVEDRIAAGEFARPAAASKTPKPKALSRSELAHRLDVLAELLRTARGDKSVSKTALVDAALAVIEPQPQADQPTES